MTSAIFARLWGGGGSTSKKQTDDIVRAQLRTPSPSEGTRSVATGPPLSPTLVSSSTRSTSPTRTAILQPPPPTPGSLLKQLKDVPAQTLYQYFKDHLAEATPSELLHLESFLRALAPPPRLHCVRCHKNYFELENTHTSCLIPHDDESAVVEHVGRTTKGKARTSIASYETHWNCCDKTVDGDGDLGPPDGWCYEGKHTTDRKRAKFRYDATTTDDKLQSCEEARCFKKRVRISEDTDDEGHKSDVTHASRKSVKSTIGPMDVDKKPRRTRRKPKSSAKVEDEEDAGHKSDASHTSRKTAPDDATKQQRKRRRVS